MPSRLKPWGRGCEGLTLVVLNLTSVPGQRTFVASTIAVGFVSLLHAAYTWPAMAVLAFFGGGVLVAFLAEAVVIHLGWLEHHIGPTVLGVPLYILPGWTGAVYVSFQLALLVTSGVPAVALAALLATTYDLLTDHRGVEEGYWTYTAGLPGPSFRGVPWWNFVGWLGISAITASIALPYL